MSLGTNIQNERKKAGYTQKQLAEKCGMAEITIRQYELDKRQPRIEQVTKIASALNIEPFYLYIGDSYIPADTPGDVSEDKPFSFPELEKIAEEIGYHIIYGTYENSDGIELCPGDVYVEYPDGERIYINGNMLEYLHFELEDYLAFKLEELRKKKQKKD